MENTEGLKWIARRRQQWLAYQLAAKLFYAIAAALTIAAVTQYVVPLPLWTYFLSCSVFFAAFVYFSGIANVSHKEIANMLDGCFPKLEYSASLLLKPKESLGMLQQLQVNRLYQFVFDLPARQFIDRRRLYLPVGMALLAAALHVAVARYARPGSDNGRVASLRQDAAVPKVSPDLPMAVTSAEVIIKPPAYTGLPARKQDDLSITAPVGSTIGLHLTTQAPLSEMTLLLDGESAVSLHQHGADSLRWDVEFRPRKTGFYQLSLDGQRSARYQLELTPDLPVAIRVTNPDQHTVIDFGFPEVVTMAASLHDDYAISNATVVATVSTGKGEGVRFATHELPLNAAVKGRKEVQVSQRIDLKKLGMGAGDELYFYVRASDNAGQESRSDVFVVVLQDTAELFSMSGMVSGVDLMPEYFRSQRQIIMDTEKLIAEMDTIATVAAHSRSNNLGIDQQLLRLRYGQFLGEEAEDAIGGHVGHEHGEDGGQAHRHLPKEEVVSHSRVRDWKNHDPNHEGHEKEAQAEALQEQETTAVPVDVETLIAEMSHQHDRAEDATFFDAEQKAHLKATLTEMWNTELRLRTYRPREALPYAYKALRLLKELQQKSRVYVGKAPTKTTPLSPEKRLTGDLTGIAGTERSLAIPAESEAVAAQQRLKQALAYLSNLKITQQLDEQGRQLLIATESSMITAASAEPAKYLHALNAIRLLEEQDGKNSMHEIRLIENAIHELLPVVERQPQQKNIADSHDIYRLYFGGLTVK